MRNRKIAHDNVFFFFFGSVGLRYKRSHFAFLISPTAPKQKVVYKKSIIANCPRATVTTSKDILVVITALFVRKLCK